MPGVLGQFSNGAIQFGDDNQIEARGTIDHPPPSATTNTPVPAASPTGGGVLPTDGGTFSRTSAPDTPIMETNTPPPGMGDQSRASAPDTDTGTGMSFQSPFTRNTGSPVDNFRSFTDQGGSPEQFFSRTLGGGLMGSSSFDEGGEVMDEDDSDGVAGQGVGASTLDPSSMFKQVLAHGRKQFGLPADFTNGPEQQQMGFDDGGVIPDDVTADGNDGGGNPNAVDPRNTLKYLSGAGAVSPEVAQALERHVDPQGGMDPDDRTMAAIQAAPTPEAKFGMMQHYRTQFNGFSGGARAAFKRGDLGQAALQANQAFGVVPTGQKVKFAPAGNGRIAMMIRGRGQQQGFEDGGEVKKDDDDDQTSSTGPRRDSDPTELPREGMRKFIGAGLLGKSPVKAGDDAWNKYHGSAGTMSMDDGGVIPDSTDDVLAAHDAMDQGDEVPAEQPQEDQTHILTPDQFHQVLQSYDAPIDEGPNFIQRLMGSLMPGQAQAAPAFKPSAGGSVDGSPTPPSAAGSADATPAEPYAPAKGGMFDPNGQRQYPGQNTQAPEKKAGPDFGDSDAQYEHQLERAKKLANQLFPMVSQGDQRNAYIAKMMDRFQEDEGKQAVEHSKGKAQIAASRDANRLAVEEMRELGRNGRATDAHRSREDIARMNNAWKALNAGQQQQIKLLGQQLVADPSMAGKPGALMQRVNLLSRGMNLDPQTLLQLAQSGGPQAEQAPAAQQQNPKANVDAATVGQVMPYTKNGVTKNYKFGADGMWHLVK